MSYLDTTSIPCVLVSVGGNGIHEMVDSYIGLRHTNRSRRDGIKE